MSDPACCILAVCCPPGSHAQRKALADALDFGALDEPTTLGRTVAEQHADWILDNFDLAPKGTLDGLKTSIAELVRKSK